LSNLELESLDSGAGKMFWSPVERALPAFIERQRWYASKTIGVESVSVLSTMLVSENMVLAIVGVMNKDKSTERYVLPVACCSTTEDVSSLICSIDKDSTTVAIFEASNSPEFWRCLLCPVQASVTLNQSAKYSFQVAATDQPWTDENVDNWDIRVHGREQSNTSVELGDSYFLKLFRRVIPGTNPDVEVGQFLRLATDFRNSPAIVNALEWAAGNDDPACLLMVSERVDCECDAWTYSLNQLDEFWRTVLQENPNPPQHPIDWSIGNLSQSVDEEAARYCGGFLDDAKLLGQRTRELHIAMGSGRSAESSASSLFSTSELATEEFDRLVAGIHKEAKDTCDLLVGAEGRISDAVSLASRIEAKATAALDEWKLESGNLKANIIRIHGDYHLGQVLRTSDDFFIIDFEGEPDRALEERREKRSAMKDVAGMIRSLHYASNAATLGLVESLKGIESTPTIEAWQAAWFQASAHAFLSGYFLPKFDPLEPVAHQSLLDLFLLEKSLYELRYEINNRPDWVQIPLRGLVELLSLND
jgi:maltose alpha-D-glucosyltransferase / alpha-amylase